MIPYFRDPPSHAFDQAADNSITPQSSGDPVKKPAAPELLPQIPMVPHQHCALFHPFDLGGAVTGLAQQRPAASIKSAPRLRLAQPSLAQGLFIQRRSRLRGAQ